MTDISVDDRAHIIAALDPSGIPVPLKVQDITAGVTGILHVREQDALAGTAVTFDWHLTPVSAVELELSMEAATTPDINTIAYCIDPPNDAIRDLWLTAGTALTTDSNRHVARVAAGSVLLEFSSPISFLGIKRDLGSDAIRVVASGVEK